MIQTQKFPRRWNKITCINFLQRKIIINAILYYELNASPLSDKEYDELSRQLVEMQKDIDIKNNTQYGYIMYDFDGTTGFDLYHRLNEHDQKYLIGIARMATNYITPKISSLKKKRKGGLF